MLWGLMLIGIVTFLFYAIRMLIKDRQKLSSLITSTNLFTYIDLAVSLLGLGISCYSDSDIIYFWIFMSAMYALDKFILGHLKKKEI